MPTEIAIGEPSGRTSCNSLASFRATAAPHLSGLKSSRGLRHQTPIAAHCCAGRQRGRRPILNAEIVQVLPFASWYVITGIPVDPARRPGGADHQCDANKQQDGVKGDLQHPGAMVRWTRGRPPPGPCTSICPDIVYDPRFRPRNSLFHRRLE